MNEKSALSLTRFLRYYRYKNSVLKFMKVSSTSCGGVKSGKTVFSQETRCFAMPD